MSKDQKRPHEEMMRGRGDDEMRSFEEEKKPQDLEPKPPFP